MINNVTCTHPSDVPNLGRFGQLCGVVEEGEKNEGVKIWWIQGIQRPTYILGRVRSHILYSDYINICIIIRMAVILVDAALVSTQAQPRTLHSVPKPIPGRFHVHAPPLEG